MALRDDQRIGPPLKVWWIPQVPMKPFEVYLNSFAEAKVLIEALAAYDLFQLKHRVKPDYSNAGGLMLQDDGDEYTDWHDGEGRQINDLTLHECVVLDRAWRNALEEVVQL